MRMIIKNNRGRNPKVIMIIKIIIRYVSSYFQLYTHVNSPFSSIPEW